MNNANPYEPAPTRFIPPRLPAAARKMDTPYGPGIPRGYEAFPINPRPKIDNEPYVGYTPRRFSK